MLNYSPNLRLAQTPREVAVGCEAAANGLGAYK